MGAAPVLAAPVVDAPRHQAPTMVIPEPGGGGDSAAGSACGAGRMAVGCVTTEVSSAVGTLQRTMERKAEAYSVDDYSVTSKPASGTLEGILERKAEWYSVDHG